MKTYYRHIFSIVVFIVALTSAANTPTCDAPLPVVDLGYAVHQAISFNETGRYYNFSNIRYARPPIGELRFVAPEPPLTNRSVVNQGRVGASCPQALPFWYICSLAQLKGEIESLDECTPENIPGPDPLEREDCLFLDVIVPSAVYEDRHTKRAPVMVWIYGGGFAFGRKGLDGDPSGLIERSRDVDPDGKGTIYVTFNYRGGAFGFLSGPNLQANGTANAGFYDQRLALEWVQTNIHLFGGDPGRVTVFGQSAGGGSIMHQLTAYGGLKGPVPFQQAIVQSPGFPLIPGHKQQDALLQGFLSRLNVSTVHEARQLPYEVLYEANSAMVLDAPTGSFIWAPAPDGAFVPALPGSLLLQGAYDKSVKLMTGFNDHETVTFTADQTSPEQFEDNLRFTFPGAEASAIDHIANVLYPPVFDGSQPYGDLFGRAELSLAEAGFTCNTFYLQQALRGGADSYGYRFSLPPAFHGQDVPYTYFNGGTDGSVNVSVALALQRHLVSFAVTGEPDRVADVEMPVYGADGLILDITSGGYRVVEGPNDNERCVWWQRSLYY